MYKHLDVGLLKLVLTFLLVIPVLSPIANGQDTTRDLQKAVHQLNFWVATQKNKLELRRQLDMNALETQAAEGHRANLSQLHMLLQKFQNSDAPDHPAVQEVTGALQNHLSNLSRQIGQDIGYVIAVAKTRYQTISLEQLERRRNEAVRDLKSLKAFYRKSIYSRERASIFYDLKIDELVEFLEGLEFELPPDLSVGKLNDQLNRMRERLRDVEEMIDELPEVDESEEDPADPPQPDDGPPAEAPAVENPQTPMPQDEQEQDDEELSNQEIIERRTELENEFEKLQKAESELQDVRQQVLSQDRPRQRTRAQVWRQLVVFNRGIVDASLKKNDYHFAKFQHSFSKFALLYFFGTDDNLQAEFNEKLDLLEQQFYKLPNSNEREAAGIVGNVLGWLDATEQATDLVRLIRATHSLPNFKVSVTRDFVNRLASQPVNDGRRVNEIILGRLIRGEAATNGSVTIDFIDDPNQANVSIHLLATITSRTHTRSGKITGFAGATGQVEARRTVKANIGGFISEEPYASAQINSEFYGVDSPIGLVQRIADKQYWKDKAISEAISSERAKNLILSQFSEETESTLNDGQERFAEVLEKMDAIGGYLPEIYLRTTWDRLWVMGHRATFKLVKAGRVSNLAAPIQSQGSSVNADVAVQLHETFLSNSVDEFLNNRTMTNDEIAAEAERLTGDVPEGLATAEDEEPWSITFAETRPIQFEFSDNRFAVTISGRRFSQGDSRIQAGLRIRIPFIIRRTAGKLKLFRDGDATIDYLDPDRKTAKIVAFKSFLETKLNSQKDDDAAREGFDLPDNLIPFDDVEQLKDVKIAREMQLVELRMVDGWLYAGWNYCPTGLMVTNFVDTPAIWQEFTISPPIEKVAPDPVPNSVVPSDSQ